MRKNMGRSGERSTQQKWQRTAGIFAISMLAVSTALTVPTAAHADHISTTYAGSLRHITNPAVSSEIPLAAKAPDGGGNKNAILNMFQWTWNSIAAECTNEIGPAGFAYVQVSPPQEHIIGELGTQGAPWWTSYQPVSYKLESKLGTAAEFENMIQTCKTAGVGIIADAVINHMTGQKTAGTGWAGTPYDVEDYPGPEGQYSSEHFHACKTDIANYGDRYDVQNCRLVALQDLDTSSEYVQKEIAAYLDKLADLGVAGFRIDAAKHMAATELEEIKGRTTSAKNKFWIHEVIGSGGEPVQPKEYLGSGDSHEFNYARTLKAGFNGKLSSLQKLGINQDLLEGYRAGVFVDNHDTERNQETLSYHAGNKYLQANVFLFSYPYASPSAYTGYTFANDGVARELGAPQTSQGEVLDVDCSEGSYTCIHRQPEIANMVGFYNDVRATELNNWQNFAGGNVVGYGRGAKGFVALNNTAENSTQTFRTFLPQGTYCNAVSSADLAGCAQSFTVDATGHVQINVPAGKSVVLWTKHSTSTGDPVYDAGETTVYFHKYSAWANLNLHHDATGTWTTAPGIPMTETCDGWYSVKVPSTGSFEGAFNNGSNWNNPLHGGNYQLSGDVIAVTHGSAINIDPCEANKVSKVVVYYKANPGWQNHNIHYGYGSKGWTTVPGVSMSPTCEGWLRKTINTDGSALEFVFNSGGQEADRVWDNPIGGGNYTSDAHVIAVADKVMTFEAPCKPEDELPEVEPEPETPPALEIDTIQVFYQAREDWPKHNIHFGRGNDWTPVPGIAMSLACEGWYTYTITDVRGQTSVSAVFNNGGDVWDNNSGPNYALAKPVVSISKTGISEENPCETGGTEEPGTEEPGTGEPGNGGTETPGPGTPSPGTPGGEGPNSGELPSTEEPTGPEPTETAPTGSAPITQKPNNSDSQVLGDTQDANNSDDAVAGGQGNLAQTGATIGWLIGGLSAVLLAAGITTVILARFKSQH